MKIQYLGTAAAEGWPAVFCSCPRCKRAKELGGKDIRTRSQAVLDEKIVFDLPPDTYLHYLRGDFDLPKIEQLFVTHSHSDHFYANELEMRCEPYCDSEAPLLNIYGNGNILQKYSEVEKIEPGIVAFCRFHLLKPFSQIDLEPYQVTALPAIHDRNEDCLIYLVSKQGKHMLYAHDTGIFSEDIWTYLTFFRLDFVSLDCTCQSQAEGSNHMGFADNIFVKNRMREMGIADEKTIFVISHFSHNGLWDHQTIEKKAKEEGMIAAYDGMVVQF
jgi:Metal-dependent hydrolases of the beta-lactamase superfamily I